MADREITLNLKEFAKLPKRVETAPKLLKQIGAMLVSDSRKAFSEQRFGTFRWQKKYGDGSDSESVSEEDDEDAKAAPPFVSVAGIVQDFGVGDRDTPLSETLVDSPALQRSGALMNSPAYRTVGDDAIELGSVLPYATLHQQGGESVQDVTPTVKERLATWLGGETKKRIKVEGFTKTGRQKTKTIKTPNSVYRARLGFLLRPDVTTLVTQVHRRPFIGITEHRSKVLAELLEEHIAGGS